MSKKRVMEAEFGVLVQLSFNLHEDPRDIFHHFALLLKVMCFKAPWRRGFAALRGVCLDQCYARIGFICMCRDQSIGRSLR